VGQKTLSLFIFAYFAHCPTDIRPEKNASLASSVGKGGVAATVLVVFIFVPAKTGDFSERKQIFDCGLNLHKNPGATSSCRTVQIQAQDKSDQNSSHQPRHEFTPQSSD
jgi:hypothetical protein